MSTEQTLSDHRLHALDAVRAYALLLGVVLHSCALLLPGVSTLQPDSGVGPALIAYSIHLFRMSAFYLMAGFFGRLLLEKRGYRAFMADRAKRILLPLVVGLPVIELTMGLFALLGAQPHGGAAYLLSLRENPPPPPVPLLTQLADRAHLWFLYYLVMFYVLALALRVLVRHIDARGALGRRADRVVAFLMRGAWGPVLLAIPSTLYFGSLASWDEWAGLPSPGSLVPDVGGVIGYVVPFGLGWLLHRQIPALLALRTSWWIYLALFAGLAALCLLIIGTAPRLEGPVLHGIERAVYTWAYMVAGWCGVFAAVGAALRFMSAPNAVTRYLADASYWVYLMHIGPILFFAVLLGPYHLHWTLTLAIMVGGTLLIMLPSYHCFVRFTWLGALLNGRRHSRAVLRASVAAS